MSGKSVGSLPRGLTLIEVVAGLALLGGLLIASVTALSAHTEQLRTADRKRFAVKAADRLLANWFENGSSLPYSDEGRLDGAHLQWRTREIGGTDAPWMDAVTIRLEILDTSDSARGQTPIVSVDLLMPREAEKNDQ